MSSQDRVKDEEGYYNFQCEHCNCDIRCKHSWRTMCAKCYKLKVLSDKYHECAKCGTPCNVKYANCYECNKTVRITYTFVHE